MSIKINFNPEIQSSDNPEPDVPKVTPVVTSERDQAWFDANIFNLAIGDVFKFDEQSIRYETVQQRVIELKPAGKEFEFLYVSPGTITYSLYGACTCVVTKNQNL